MKRFLALSILVFGCDAASAAAPPDPQEGNLRKKLIETYGSAADWLVGQQDPYGAWLMGPPGKALPSPAYTALITTSLANAPEEIRAKYKPAVDKAVGFLLSKANKDGSFGEGPTGAFMKTYTTALALMALGSVDPRKHGDAIRGAQAYLKNNQLKEDGAMKGGLGYGDDKPKVGEDGKLNVVKETVANMSVTGFAAEGLKMSGLPQDDEFWKLVIEFVRRCQNNSETNTDPQFMAALKAKGLSIDNDGGLFYAPIAEAGASKAGTRKLADKEVLLSYGAMTYDGIKTYLYAGLKKTDKEVVAAMDWVRKNYSVDVHPGFAHDEKQRHHLRGLYHYYVVMARALDAFGEHPLVTFDGKKRDWARDIAEKLLQTVKDSRMWVNENAAWYEGDPVLVTSYVLMTCDVILKYIK